MAIRWLEEQPVEVRALLYVYRLTARDYGSPTTRVRCVITTFELKREHDLNPFHE